jgi:hypothetical protein
VGGRHLQHRAVAARDDLYLAALTVAEYRGLVETPRLEAEMAIASFSARATLEAYSKMLQRCVQATADQSHMRPLLTAESHSARRLEVLMRVAKAQKRRIETKSRRTSRPITSAANRQTTRERSRLRGLCRQPPHRGTNPRESARIRRYLGGPHGWQRLLTVSQNCPQTRHFSLRSARRVGLVAPPLKIVVSPVRIRVSPLLRKPVSALVKRAAGGVPQSDGEEAFWGTDTVDEHSSDLARNALTAVPLGIAFALRSQVAKRRAGLAVVAAIFISACVASVEAVVALGAPIADPLIGLAITLVILRITWKSWDTVRGHHTH